MTEIPPFFRDASFPERKWFVAAFLLFLLHYLVTRVWLNTERLPEPFETIVGLAVYILPLIGAWFVIGGLKCLRWWRAALFVPLFGWFVAVVFFLIASNRSR